MPSLHIEAVTYLQIVIRLVMLFKVLYTSKLSMLQQSEQRLKINEFRSN